LMSTQCAAFFSRVCIPHLEGVVIRSRHDGVSCWADRTFIHITCMTTQCTKFLSCKCIPHLEGVVIRGRHDGVSCWTDRTPIHHTHMPTQCANQCRVWQVWQQVPTCQVGALNFLLECLAQVCEFLQIFEAAQEDWSKFVIVATAVE